MKKRRGSPTRRRKSPKKHSKRKYRRKSPKKRRKSKSPRRVKFRFGGNRRYVIYTHPVYGLGCPACAEAKKLLQSKKLSYSTRKGTNDPRPSHPTWPKIYGPSGNFIGGYGDLRDKLK